MGLQFLLKVEKQLIPGVERERIVAQKYRGVERNTRMKMSPRCHEPPLWLSPFPLFFFILFSIYSVGNSCHIMWQDAWQCHIRGHVTWHVTHDLVGSAGY